MKLSLTPVLKYKFRIAAPGAFVLFTLLNLNTAFGQIDYTYGRNNSGVRLSIGGGASTLMTHFNQNPFQAVGIGSLDYDVNPYFSFGLEAQAGKLKGVDDLHHLYYASSTDNYLSGTVNVRFAPGMFYDIEYESVLTDALKRIYIGTGLGKIHTDIKFTYHPERAFTAYGVGHPYGNYYVVPFNIGTNIDLLGVAGYDRLSINPNFQVNYVNNLYLDGFQSSATNPLKGLYNIVSVKLKYKF